MSLDQRHSPRALLGHGALPQTDKRCCPGKLPDNPRALHTTQRVTKANLTKQEKIWTIVFTTEGGQKKARFSGKKEGGWGGGGKQLIVRVVVKLQKQVLFQTERRLMVSSPSLHRAVHQADVCVGCLPPARTAGGRWWRRPARVLASEGRRACVPRVGGKTEQNKKRWRV